MTTSTSTLTLDTFFNAVNPTLEPLRDGRVKIRGVDMHQLKMPNVIIPFRRMCRTQEFDISELAVVTYFAARQYDLPFTAIPVFPSSWIQDGQAIAINEKAGVHSAKDLEGKTVGMRAYTVTPSAWQRGYLQEQGCDLSKVTWLSQDEEHVKGFHADAPANLHYEKGADLQALLGSGEIAAAFSVQVEGNLDIRQLNPNAREDGIECFKRDGVYRVIHLMLVHNRVLEDNPWVLRATYDAFKEAKEVYVAEKGPFEPWDDPLPMGMSATRKSLETLMGLCIEQGVLKRPLDIDELFPGNFD